MVLLDLALLRLLVLAALSGSRIQICLPLFPLFPRAVELALIQMGGVDAFPPEESVEDLIKEAEDLRKCAALVSSLGQRVVRLSVPLPFECLP